jgi:hypothetical protein
VTKVGVLPFPQQSEPECLVGNALDRAMRPSTSMLVSTEYKGAPVGVFEPLGSPILSTLSDRPNRA